MVNLSQGVQTIAGLAGRVLNQNRAETLREPANALSTLASASKLTLLVPASLIGLSGFTGFPDRDIEVLGIGSHRFFLFHSGVAIKAMETLYKRWYELGDRSTIERVLKKVGGVALGGAAFGVGLHLLSDALHPKSVIFPIFGSLLGGTMLDDTLWLLGNSLWCFKMGRDVMMLAAGDDIAEVSAYLRAKLGEGDFQWSEAR